MAEFLTKKGVGAKLESILREARSRIILISPYLQVSKEYLERLGDAASRGVQISVIFRENKVNAAELAALKCLPRIGLRCLENLHAKCYSNDTKILISSMNLYENSERYNVEMGILLDAAQDTLAFESARQEIEDIRQKASPIIDYKSQVISGYSANHLIQKPMVEEHTGHCIRCALSIPHSLEKPLCKSCYNIWAQYKDPEFEEYFCHTCGNSGDTSMSHPECYKCYSGHKRQLKKIG